MNIQYQFLKLRRKTREGDGNNTDNHISTLINTKDTNDFVELFP